MTGEDIKTIIDIVHKTIYGFFDVCGDDEETPMTDKDKLLLKVNKAICNNIKTLDQEPSGDLISRQAVLDILEREGHKWGNDYRDWVDAVNEVETLPSVNPQEPKTEPKYCDRNICVSNEYNGIGCEDCEVTKSQEPKTGHCKECKYFEYDSVAKVDGVPLIVAHEICSRWGDGCKTKEDGYCFLFEPQESEEI